jgi:hypothetical protein
MMKSFICTTTALVIYAVIKTNFASLFFVSAFHIRSNGVAFPSSRRNWSRHVTHIDTAEERALSSSFSKQKANHPLGPPEPLKSMPMDSSLPPYESFRYDAFGNVQNFEVRRVSNIPDIFHIRGFVSTMERHTLLWTDRNSPQDANVFDSNEAKNRTNCCVSWMFPDEASGTPGKLARSAPQLLFSSDMKEGKGGSGLYEQLQFVRYNEEGEFLLHHDEHDRVLTVIYYLNGVAGTWFPLAGNWDGPPTTIPRNKEEALKLIETRGLIPGEDGVLFAGGRDSNQYGDCQAGAVVHVSPGDAVAFYNYDTGRPATESARIDWRAIHAGMPASEEKYIATHWFHGGDLV